MFSSLPWGNDPIWLFDKKDIQMGWNHKLDKIFPQIHLDSGILKRITVLRNPFLRPWYLRVVALGNISMIFNTFISYRLPQKNNFLQVSLLQYESCIWWSGSGHHPPPKTHPPTPPRHPETPRWNVDPKGHAFGGSQFRYDAAVGGQIPIITLLQAGELPFQLLPRHCLGVFFWGGRLGQENIWDFQEFIIPWWFVFEDIFA